MAKHNYSIDELFDYDKHGNVIVYDADLLDELIYVEDKTDDDIDWLNTRLMRLECPYKQMNIHLQKFENNLEVAPNIPDPEGYKSIFMPFSIDNEDIPLDMRNLGCR